MAGSLWFFAMRSLPALRNRFGETLDATLTPGNAGRDTVVLVGHGVTSHKERPWQVAICDAAAAAGFDAVRFTYAGNPGSEGQFAATTVSKEAVSYTHLTLPTIYAV